MNTKLIKKAFIEIVLCRIMLGYTKCEGLALQIHTFQADDVYPNLFIFPKEGLSSGLCLGSGTQ
jgi:hypothetical protein